MKEDTIIIEIPWGNEDGYRACSHEIKEITITRRRVLNLIEILSKKLNEE